MVADKVVMMYAGLSDLTKTLLLFVVVCCDRNKAN